MKQPEFWKVSMCGNDFDDVLEVLDWLRQGLVLVHGRTKKKAGMKVSQGEQFLHPDRQGDYFYLCHGNRTSTDPRRGIILLGRFTGEPEKVTHHKWSKDDGWYGRRFEWISTAISSKKLSKKYGQRWTPRDNGTFWKVPQVDWLEFEAGILKPYFARTMAEFEFKC